MGVGNTRQSTADGHVQTLSALRTIAMVDSALMYDFGDGGSMLDTRGDLWETEMTHTHQGSEHAWTETTRASIIPHDNATIEKEAAHAVGAA